MKTYNPLIYRLMLFAAAAIWGSSFIIVKSSVDSVPPNLLIFFRFASACVLLSLIFIKSFRQFRFSTLKRGIICGFFLFAGYALQTFGITFTTPGKNAFLTAIYCVIVPFLFWGVGKVKPDVYNVAAAVACLAGIGFVAFDGGVDVNIGDMLTIICGIAFAFQIVFVALFTKDENPILLTIVQFASVALFALLLSIIMGETVDIRTITPGTAVGIAYLSIFATAAALLLQTIGQSRVPPTTVSLIVSLEAVFGVIFSIIFTGEKITLRNGIGFALIFVAIVISETKLSFVKLMLKKSENREENI